MENMKRAVVVGGGISGILSALLLKKRGFESVDIIEKEPQLGGLLRSWTEPKHDATFDYGAHFVAGTGDKEIDDLMLSPVREEWHKLRPLKSGTYYRGLREKSPCPDIRILPEDIYNRAVVELLTAEETKNPRNLREYLIGHFGPTITETIYAPVMRKLMGSPLEVLHPNSYRLYTSQRLIALTPEATRALKTIPAYEDRLAFHSFMEGFGPLETFYPDRGGCGSWIAGLEKSLREMGVRIHCGIGVARIGHRDGRIQSVALSDSGATLPCDFLVWSGALPACLDAAAIPYKCDIPRLQKTILYHYIFDRPFLTKVFFVTCFDPDLVSFRVTLYPNVTGPASAPFQCTVEVNAPADADEEKWGDQVKDELVKMGIVAPEARELYRRVQSESAGFPVMTTDFVRSCDELRERAARSLSNLALVGKALGQQFFMHAVMLETRNTLNAALKKEPDPLLLS